MTHHPCVQGSDEWKRLRFGKPTASEFDNIITAAKWEPTASQARRSYMMRILAELIIDIPLTGASTASMEHGHAWEPKARAAYEFERGVDVELCGFCTDDAGTIGASPDGFVGEDGSIEIKCPEKPEIHCGYLVDSETLKKAYFVQTQGQLFVTGRKWTDLVSYFGGMPMVCERVKPVEEFQAKLGYALQLFTRDLALYVDMAKDRGWIKPPKSADAPSDKYAVTMADLEFILAAQREQHARV